MFKYFTVQTANETLPLVIERYANIKKQKNEVIKAEQELQVTLTDNNTFEKYVVLKQKLNEKLSKFYKTIQELEETGFRPLNPESFSCQNFISVSPSFQQSHTSSSNLFEGKSSKP